MVNRLDDREKLLRESSRKAIALAMESRWQEAAEVNRAVVELAPDDVDAYNRLGKALLELGDAPGASDAFTKALALSPGNAIARKNLDRIASMPQDTASCVEGHRIAPRLFIGDSGKSARVSLLAVTAAPQRPFLSSGAPVELRKEGDDLAVYAVSGQRMGLVPPRLGRRLVKLIAGGNEYQGAVFNITGDDVRVVLHETYQAPSQRNIVSFPSDRPETTVEPKARRQPETAQDDDEIEWDLPSSWKADAALDTPLAEMATHPDEEEFDADDDDDEDEE